MWGNRLGWGISGVIVAITGVLVYALWALATQSTPPTGWVENNIPAIKVPGDPASVVPDMTDSTDAGPLYRKAIDDGTENESEYATLAAVTTVDDSALNRPGIKAILDATRCTNMSLFKDHPEDVVNYSEEKKPLKALKAVTAAMVQNASLMGGRGRQEDAKRYWKALFSLGVKLYQEHQSYDELATGLALMSESLASLQSLAEQAKDDKLALEYRSYAGTVGDDMNTKLRPAYEAMHTLDDNMIKTHAGDYAALLEARDKDPMWRAEAAFAVGRLKYRAFRRGDQINALQLLKKVALDPTEPKSVHAAATAARDLTEANYMSLN